ncbi:response regulator transcription factor [Thiothrix litoralis]|jgi:two-component system OmpR family response regulator|uniref:Response regulator transcription factor n=1 Tax=Thiothrix litoralis TaxID=2891210 RepID=A0ABX7WNE2_9GAMM|nr:MULTISPECIES: response regulator transcription factor [Thiothrix]QTR44577.1 response regulator transcription factor [Thiothrix litoralis]
MSKLLLVDDDIELTTMLAEYLEREGFSVTTVQNGEAAVREALNGDYALVVLDVMMPGMSGIEALSRIRTHSKMPVLMLTARGDDIDRIIGLELGADDYVPKPCMPRELVARIRAILRRTSNDNAAMSHEPLHVGELSLHPDKRQTLWHGQALELTSTEFNLLEVLARQAGQTVSKADLSTHGLGRALTRYDRSIDVHMSSIRHKLGNLPDGRSCIQTVRGVGYQLIGE